MGVPWLRILDAVIGVTDLARSRKIRTLADDQRQLETTGRVPATLETRLAGVVVAALKEAFDRDTRRLELEREEAAAERARAERALRLELQRQAADREIGRLRLLAGVAATAWIGTLFFSSRLIGGAIGARVMLGCGWLLLLAALAVAFTAQSRVAASLDASSRDEVAASGRSISPVAGGAVAPWLIVAGLALIGLAVLVA
jgi:hypothetical protein